MVPCAIYLSDGGVAVRASIATDRTEVVCPLVCQRGESRVVCPRGDGGGGPPIQEALRFSENAWAHPSQPTRRNQHAATHRLRHNQANAAAGAVDPLQQPPDVGPKGSTAPCSTGMKTTAAAVTKNAPGVNPYATNVLGESSGFRVALVGSGEA